MCIRSLLNAEVDMHISVLQSLDKKLDTSRRGQEDKIVFAAAGLSCCAAACSGWVEMLLSCSSWF